MGIMVKAFIKTFQAFLDHGVAADDALKSAQLLAIRKCAIQQQIGYLDKAALFRQLFDRITAIQEQAGIAIDIGYTAAATGRGLKPWIEGEIAKVTVKCSDVHRRGPHRTVQYREFNALARTVISYSNCILSHSIPPFPRR